MDIKYFIRTMENRKINIPIEYEPIIDYEHKYVKSYIDALYRINDYNAVLMEDDIVLCNNFEKEVEKVVNQYPDSIINFFNRPELYYTTHYSNIFAYNQCTYFPKGITKMLADEMMTMYLPEDKYPKQQKYGTLLSLVLHNKGIPHLIYRPCLVQHIDGKSTFNNVHQERNTIYFKDYLDKLGIDMIEAFKVENREKLKQMLEEDKIKWYNT